MANTGLTFYDLVSKYEGDVSTSGCGVTKHQLDMNFYNLKSEDIKNAYWDAENRKLVILFYNGQKLEVGDINPNNLEYNEAEQTLIGITADGKKFAVATGLINDGSLEGDNTFQNPIGVARSLRTGFHMPAMRVVTELPKDGLTNVKYVYKTDEDRLGRLYTAEEVIKINDYLKSIKSPWHVPTKEEWDNMLNAIEPCDADKNHDKVDVDAGRIAGELLKDGHLWDGYNAYNFSLLPVDTMVKMAGIDTDGNVFGKVFKSEIETSSNTVISNKVFGATINTDKLYAIRLVKYGVFHEHEKVMDEEYDCVKMPAWKDGKYLVPMVWLAQNVYEDDILGTAIGTYVPSKKIEPTYYVIEYDSLISDWHRFKMNIGDSIYCMNDNSIYTLIHTKEDGCVLETSSDIYNSSIASSYYDQESQQLVISFNDNNRVREIGFNLDNLINWIKEQIKELNDKINTETENRTKADNAIKESLSEEIAARKDADNAEANTRANADKQEHDSRVKADKEESEARIKADTEEATARQSADNTEKEARIEADTKEHNERISADTLERESRMLGDMQETKARTENDNLEKEARINADNTILSKLDEETTAREEGNRALSASLLSEIVNESNERKTNDNIILQNLSSISKTFEEELELEQEARVSKDIELRKSLDDETSARIALANKVDKAINDRLLTETELAQRIEDEATSREESDSNLTKSINDEVLARESADTKLDERVDTLEETIEGVKEKLNGEDDKFALLQKAIEDEVKDRQLADENESSDRLAADENETKDRQFADDLLKDLINNEVDARKTADELLKANIETLKTLISISGDVDKEAIDKLTGWLAELALRITGVESGLTSEEEVRESEDNYLQQQIDEIKASGSPISEEVIENIQEQIDVLDEKVVELSGRTLSADTSVLQEEIDEIRDEIEELSGRTVSADTSVLQEEIDELADKINEISTSTNEISANTLILQDEVDDLNDKIENFSGCSDVSELKEEVEEIKDELSHITSGGTIDTNTELAIAGALNYLRYQQLNMLQRLHDLDHKGVDEE